jgi:hypothetical protein
MTNKKDFYIKFKTKDNQLVMDRKSDSEWYCDTLPNGYFIGFNKEFVNNILDTDSRIKGVRVISYEITKQGIDAIVEWLK